VASKAASEKAVAEKAAAERAILDVYRSEANERKALLHSVSELYTELYKRRKVEEQMGVYLHQFRQMRAKTDDGGGCRV